MADDQHPSEGPRVSFRLIGLVVVLVVLVWFAIVNRDRVKVSFLVVDTHVRLVYALVVAAALGALADRLATFRRNRR